jgi:peroxiredoxin
LAPDFSLPDYRGGMVTLSDLYPTHNVLLVFNIGFI